MLFDRNANLRATIKRSPLSPTILFSNGKFLLQNNNQIYNTNITESILDVYLGRVGNEDFWAAETKLKSENFVEMRSNLFKLNALDQKLVGLGYSMINWNLTNLFCSQCGSRTISLEAGYKRKCENLECRTNKSLQNTCYPRLDPVVIVLVTSPNGKKVLLGRQKSWEPKRYSCIGIH